MATQPKVFTAVKAFNVDTFFFKAGDVVEGRALDEVLKYGDEFVTSSSTTTDTSKEQANG